MSITINDGTINNKDLNLNEKVVFSFLAKVGKCSDSLSTIKDMTGVDSVDILRRTLKSLVSKGYITTEVKYSNSPTTYLVESVNTSENVYHNEEKINPKSMLFRHGEKTRRSLLD